MTHRTHLGAAACACACLGVGVAVATMIASAPDPTRGRGLYEQRCGTCHSESVHGRVKRVARNYDEIRAWVQRWNSTLELGWGTSEVEDVTVYLNDTYYRYTLPAGARW